MMISRLIELLTGDKQQHYVQAQAVATQLNKILDNCTLDERIEVFEVIQAATFQHMRDT